MLVLGFTVTSSLLAAVSENRWWMLGCGLLCAIVLPALVASWIRSLRRPSGSSSQTSSGGEETARPTRPTTVSLIVIGNLVAIVGAGLLAPATTARRLSRHGAWWVESIAAAVGRDRKSPVVRGAQRSFEWLASLLPVEQQVEGPGPVPVGQNDTGIAVPAAPAAPDLSVPDSALEPPLPGEVRVRFERRGSAVVLPVVLHGPTSHASVKMLFDTGATLTTVDEATLRRLGVFISTSDPTIETHTANGMVRRAVTVIEAVTLGVARLGGGMTVAVCDPCAKGDVVGLLGMNVLRHFKVTLDDEAGQLVLWPRRRASPGGDLADIRPFIRFTAASGSWRGPMLTVTATLHNQSPRPLRYVKVVAVMREGKDVGKVWGELRDVPARGEARLKLEGLSPVKSARFELQLERADW